jgi:hypothetical protein
MTISLPPGARGPLTTSAVDRASLRPINLCTVWMQRPCAALVASDAMVSSDPFNGRAARRAANRPCDSETGPVTVKRTSRLSERSKRLISDSLLIAGLVAAFLTNDSGALIHSVVSLIFAVFVVLHVRRNWKAYRRPLQWSRAAVNQATAISMALAIATGLVWWWAGDRYSLGHGPISVAAAIILLPHVWVHRRSLIRLVRGKSPDRRTRTSE